MKFFRVIIIYLSSISILYGQNPPVNIATWKNNASGAYNIIHDDFGDYGVIGIQNYADTMHYNRGLKFTFGAITSSCEGNPGMYATAQSMISNHGHEIINHSHTHSCAVMNSNCGGTGPNYGWAVTGATQRFNIEVDQSTQSILTNTGIQPRFFIYPYDQFNTESDAYLQSKGYIGSRTGDYNAAAPNNFAPNAGGFFNAALVVDAQNVNGQVVAVNLNSWVDEAINNNMWVNRELHNVGDAGWGHVTETDYRDHLNYVKQKVTAGQLWVGTISEILTYQIQKLNYVPSSAYNATTKDITVSWNNPAFNVANYLSPLVYKSPITLNVDLTNYPGLYLAYQNGVQLTDYKMTGNMFSVNVYPHQGPVILKLQNCPGVCIISQPVGKTLTIGQSFTLSVTAYTQSGSLTYQWYKNGTLINGASSANFTVNNSQLADAGNYYVVVGNGTTTANSNTVTVTINDQSPYAGYINIPGKFEAENFDIGGQGISYNESTATDQGGSGYRTGPVDIEVGGSNYDVGYITDGEWLEYSVNVTATGIYDFEFRIASVNSGVGNGNIKVQIDGVDIISSYTIPYTGGWGTFQTSIKTGVNLNSGGVHILRLFFTKGNFNLDFVNVVLRTPLSINFSSGDNYVSNKIEDIVKLYPNPSSGFINIVVPITNEELLLSNEIEISDLTGKVLQKENIKYGVNSFDVSSLPIGVYQMKIPYHDSYIYKKFLKQE